MAAKTPEQIAAKFQRRVAAAGQDYLEGVQNPSKDWGQATAAASARWQAGLQEAIAAGSFQKGVQAAGTAKWQQRAASTGAQRYTAAAPEAAQAYAQVAGRVMAAAEAARRAADAMPGTTFEQRIQRATAAMTATRAYWKGQSGR